jgi:hypothetical protein
MVWNMFEYRMRIIRLDLIIAYRAESYSFSVDIASINMWWYFCLLQF